jgi:hypothetical protein
MYIAVPTFLCRDFAKQELSKNEWCAQFEFCRNSRWADGLCLMAS